MASTQRPTHKMNVLSFVKELPKYVAQTRFSRSAGTSELLHSLAPRAGGKSISPPDRPRVAVLRNWIVIVSREPTKLECLKLD